MDSELWIVVISSILSCFFGLAGFTLGSLSWSKIGESLSESKRTGKNRLRGILEKNLKALQLTLSLCRAVTHFCLVVGMVMLINPGGEELNWLKFLEAVAWSSAIIALLGVAIPFTWASYAGEKVLIATLPVLLVLRWLLWPVIAFMELFDLPIRRLSGAEEHSEDQQEEEAKAEILQAAADGAAEGAVDADEVEMIESVMEFGETRAAEIMTPRTDIFALESDTLWQDAANAIHNAGHTRVPVYEGNLDNITGIIYAKDLLQYINTEDRPELNDIARKPFFVPETKCLDDLLREFKARKVHIAIVLDEYGGTAGLVSIEDVLEEIVGDISDEYDEAVSQQIMRVDEDTLDVDGRLRVDDLNDELDIDLPEEENYDTVAGFAVSNFGYIPLVGEKFATDQAEFEVLDADERKIIKLRVHKLEEVNEE